MKIKLNRTYIIEMRFLGILSKTTKIILENETIIFCTCKKFCSKDPI